MSAHVYLGLAASELTVLAVGLAVLFALGLLRGWRDLKLLGLAYLVGWGVLGVALSYALVLGVAFDLEHVLVIAALLVAVCAGIGLLTPRVPAVARAATGNPLARTALVLGAAIVVLSSLAALVVAVQTNWTADFDVVWVWVPRAGIIYYHHGLWLGIEGWSAFDHPEYPPLASTMYAASFAFVGGFHPSLLSFQQTLLGLSFVGAALALLDRCVPRWLTLPSIGLLMVSPGFFKRLDSLLPDQTLAYLVASAGIACVIWLRERRGAWLALTVILMVAATLTKQEGETYAFLLALIVCGGAALLRERRTALPALALFAGPAAIEPWRIWLGDHGLPTTAEDYHFSFLLHPVYLADRVDRLPYALEGIFTTAFRPSEWLPILPLALLVILAVSRRLPLFAAASAVWLVLAFLGLLIVYWIGAEPVHPYVDQTKHRVVATIVIVAGALLPLLLGLALGERRRSPKPR